MFFPMFIPHKVIYTCGSHHIAGCLTGLYMSDSFWDKVLLQFYIARLSRLTCMDYFSVICLFLTLVCVRRLQQRTCVLWNTFVDRLQWKLEAWSSSSVNILSTCSVWLNSQSADMCFLTYSGINVLMCIEMVTYW